MWPTTLHPLLIALAAVLCLVAAWVTAWAYLADRHWEDQ